MTAEQDRAAKARRMEEVIRGYFDACNTGDADAVATWYHFDPHSGLIAEIRAYYASPANKEVRINELVDFDYAGRGYALQSK